MTTITTDATIAPQTITEVLAEIRATLADWADFPAGSYDLDQIARACYVEVPGEGFYPKGHNGPARHLDEVDESMMWDEIADALLPELEATVTEGDPIGGERVMLITVRGYNGWELEHVEVGGNREILDGRGSLQEHADLLDWVRERLLEHGLELISQQGQTMRVSWNY